MLKRIHEETAMKANEGTSCLLFLRVLLSSGHRTCPKWIFGLVFGQLEKDKQYKSYEHLITWHMTMHRGCRFPRDALGKHMSHLRICTAHRLGKTGSLSFIHPVSRTTSTSEARNIKVFLVGNGWSNKSKKLMPDPLPTKWLVGNLSLSKLLLLAPLTHSVEKIVPYFHDWIDPMYFFRNY